MKKLALSLLLTICVGSCTQAGTWDSLVRCDKNLNSDQKTALSEALGGTYEHIGKWAAIHATLLPLTAYATHRGLSALGRKIHNDKKFKVNPYANAALAFALESFMQETRRYIFANTNGITCCTMGDKTKYNEQKMRNMAQVNYFFGAMLANLTIAMPAAIIALKPWQKLPYFAKYAAKKTVAQAVK